MSQLIEQMKMDLSLMNYSPKTIMAYTYHIKKFLETVQKPAESVTSDDIKCYLYEMKNARKWSQSNLSQAFSGIKFLYRKTLDMPLQLSDVKTRQRGRKLPVVLSCEEVKRLLSCLDNMKHKTILMTIYSAGLRLSEATALKVPDIDSHRMQIRVEQGKGKKDRYTLLSRVLLSELRHYWRHYKPRTWLFPNRQQTRPINPATVQRIFHHAKKKPAS